VFFGPLVARANVQRQIQATSQESWMREFRQQVVALICAQAALRDHARRHTNYVDPSLSRDEKRQAEIRVAEDKQRLDDALNPHYQTIRLLLAEKGADDTRLLQKIDDMLGATTFEAAALMHQFFVAAEDILRRERRAIETDPGLWPLLRGWLSRLIAKN
jgi:hypothetical protein